jgi:hypothetical protein
MTNIGEGLSKGTGSEHTDVNFTIGVMNEQNNNAGG